MFLRSFETPPYSYIQRRWRKRKHNSVTKTFVFVFATVTMTSQSLFLSAYLVGMLLEKPMIASSLQTSSSEMNSPAPMEAYDDVVVHGALPTAINNDDTFIEIEGHTIGDEHRSETSSKQFFNFIDTDRDGKLEQTELSNFLKDHIGGMTLDTDVEAQMEAEAILDRLDHNKDDKLDSKDVFRYWKSLESLLTVEEVAEWVVHSVQLPPEIGDIFRENHVTGYDFPELVDNGGQALLDELKIEKPTFRKKIVRLVNARMLGIGSKPNPPSGIKIELEGCSTAILKWKRTKADGFPVHKFRVQRRRLGGDYDHPQSNHSEMMSGDQCIKTKRLHGDESTKTNNEICESPNRLDRHMGDLMEYSSRHQKTCSINDSYSTSCTNHPSQSSSSKYLGWHTVYDQSLPEFHDFGLERGHRGYRYRIQAWNAVGKSDWVMVEIKHWGRKKCYNTKPNQNHQRTSETSFSFWSSFVFILESLYSISSIIWGLFLAIGGVIKLQRATLTSTATKVLPVQTFVFKYINESTRSIFGREIIPKAYLGNIIDGEGTSSVSYEVSVNQHKVAGYEQINRPNLPPSNIPMSTSNKNLIDDSNDDKPKEETKSNKTQNPLKFLKSKSIAKLSQNIDTTRTEDFLSTRNEISARSLCTEVPNQDGNYTSSPEEVDDNIQNIPQPTSKDESVNSSSQKKMNIPLQNIDNHCTVCQKKFKLFGKRKRHHCAICYASFCHQHGKTTHSALVPCKVPGDCICNNCLESAS